MPKLIGVHHGHPEDLPADALSHGWDCYRFNGLFGPWKVPTPRAAEILWELSRQTGQKCLVVLLHANTFPLALTTGGESQFWERVQKRLLDPYGFGVAALDWLAGQNLQDHVMIDITNGPERPWDTTYKHLQRFHRADLAGIMWELEREATSREFQVVKDSFIQRRHFYVHREDSARDYWERSETAYPSGPSPSRIWYTEVGVHETVPDRAAALQWLLTVGTWEAERVYVHAPYQQNDGAGYGGLWHNPVTKAVLQSHLTAGGVADGGAIG